MRVDLVELAPDVQAHLFGRADDKLLETGLIRPDEQKLRQSAGESLDRCTVTLPAGEAQAGTNGLGYVGGGSEGVADLREVIGLQTVSLGLLSGLERRDLPAGDDAVEAIYERRFKKDFRKFADIVLAPREVGGFS